MTGHPGPTMSTQNKRGFSTGTTMSPIINQKRKKERKQKSTTGPGPTYHSSPRAHFPNRPKLLPPYSNRNSTRSREVAACCLLPAGVPVLPTPPHSPIRREARMEDLATVPPPRHRARRHRRKASDSATYGDVFGGGPRFAPSLAGVPADYADVFGGVAASCSIPYLDLPPAAAGSDGGAGRYGEIDPFHPSIPAEQARR